LIRAAFFGAQGLLSFLPALLVLLVSRSDSDRAAEFSVSLGVVGALFSIAYFGQRAYVAVRGFDTIACREAIGFRAMLTVIATLLAVLLTFGMSIPLSIALFAVGLKLSESIIDLWVGIRIRTSSDRQSSMLYLQVAALRAVLITAPILMFGADRLIASYWGVPYLLLLAGAGYLMAHLDTRRLGIDGGYWVSPKRAIRVGWEMRSFVSATAVCALLSSMPRVILPYAESGTYSGPALALSVVPLFGLAFQALWLSRLKRMTAEGAAQVRWFVLEVAVIAAACCMLSPLWEWGAKEVYHLEASAQREGFAQMVAAGVILTAAVSLSNLCKLTSRPRNESLSYAFGLTVVLVSVFALGMTTATAMLSAAALMALFLIVTLRGGPGFLTAGEPVTN
jgi:hypothetical protein